MIWERAHAAIRRGKSASMEAHAARGIKRKTAGMNNLMLICLALPMFLSKLIFHYIPMTGIVLAFKDFHYAKGIFGSPWVGLDNFAFFFQSPDAWRTARNTLGYNISFILLGTVSALLFALLLYEVGSKAIVKYAQTSMLLPHFMSWVIVAFIAYGFLSYKSGILNGMLASFGLDKVNWYTSKTAWIFIFPIANTWKNLGMSSIIYYACLMGVDPAYYEAAKVEGANRLQIATRITLPFLYPLVIMLGILDVGKIFNADFGLFYQLPKDSTIIYETTDVIETYIFRALKEQGNMGMATAVDLYKSLISFALVIGTNQLVKKFSPENTLF